MNTNRTPTIQRPATVTHNKTDGVVLAADVFRQPVRLDPDYLKTPSGLLCARGTLIDRKRNRLIPQRCKLRSCPYCRAIMAGRRMRQIQFEEIKHWTRIGTEKWKAYQKRHNYHHAPYIAFCQGEITVVVSELGKYDLPMEDDEIKEIETVKLIDAWIENIPKGKRVSPSNGFGGEQWSGARAKPEKGRYVRVGYDIEVVVAHVKTELERQARAIQASERDLRPDWHGVYHTTSNVVNLALVLNMGDS